MTHPPGARTRRQRPPAAIVRRVQRPTAKGTRQAERILDAAYRCLSTYGYSGTSLQRIADEAGTNKRMVVYYFESRERLLEAVMQRVGKRLLQGVAAEVESGRTALDAVERGFERLWQSITEDRELSAVYFGLFAEAVTDPALRATLTEVNEAYRGLVRSLLRRVRGPGHRADIDDESLAIAIIAVVQGLTLEYIERGDSPALRRAIASFKRWVAGVLTEPREAQAAPRSS